MPDYIAESYSGSLVRETKKHASTFSLPNPINQGRQRYSTVLPTSAIASILLRTTRAPKPATWAAQSFYSEGGGGGVTSEEFPTVYGYL